MSKEIWTSLFQHPTEHPFAFLVSWEGLNFWFDPLAPIADTALSYELWAWALHAYLILNIKQN